MVEVVVALVVEAYDTFNVNFLIKLNMMLPFVTIVALMQGNLGLNLGVL